MDLYPYQKEGVAFLTPRRRAYLADEMGLGKTVQAVRAAELVLPPGGTALVISPASAVPNWRREVKWDRRKDTTWRFVSYSQLTSHTGRYRFYYLRPHWDLVILDEAHYCKTPTAARTRRALRLAKKADRAWLLSGTPMPNHPGELFAPIRVLWPGICEKLGLTEYRAWFDHFAKWRHTKYGPQAYALNNPEDLRPYLPRIMLRRLLKEVGIQLPPLRVDVHTLPQDAAMARAVEEAGLDLADLRARITAEEGDKDGSLSRLRRLLGSLKAPRIAEQIDRELRDQAYQKIVVLYYHRDTGAVLRQALSKHGVTGFDGATSQGARQAAIDAFTEEPGVRVFLAQQSAAGVAINLQAASEVVLVEPAWSPDDNAQAVKRIHRIGQDNPCRARLFAVEGSLDEAIMEAVARKLRMQRGLGLQAGGATT